MKIKIISGAAAVLAASIIVVQAAPGDDLTNAVNALSGKASYSWKSTVVVPEGSPFHPGPTTGKTEKDGYTDVTMSFGGNSTEFVLKGDQAAVNTQDNGWQSPADMASAQGPSRYMATMVKNFKAPAMQAAALAASASELKKDDDVISGDMTEAGAKALLSRPRRGGGAAPQVTNPKGSIKFWMKDGTLSKFEFKVSGTVTVNGEDRDMSRDTTVEITDVGTTKITVPDEAMKILAPKLAADAPAKQ